MAFFRWHTFCRNSLKKCTQGRQLWTSEWCILPKMAQENTTYWFMLQNVPRRPPNVFFAIFCYGGWGSLKEGSQTLFGCTVQLIGRLDGVSGNAIRRARLFWTEANSIYGPSRNGSLVSNLRKDLRRASRLFVRRSANRKRIINYMGRKFSVWKISFINFLNTRCCCRVSCVYHSNSGLRRLLLIYVSMVITNHNSNLLTLWWNTWKSHGRTIPNRPHTASLTLYIVSVYHQNSRVRGAWSH